VHWVNAAAFIVLLVTGLFLYIPSLEVAVGRRPLLKDIHFWAGVCWLPAVLLVALSGDRRGLLRTVRDVEVLRPSRFNVGQKVNAVLTAAFAVLFLVSGLFLWLGERDTGLRFASTVVLHDGLFFAAFALLLGHLYLALIHPATRHSLRGMTLGTVSEEWAERHYPQWIESGDGG
jgi:formate dehydrogenase subunit gamma